MFLCCKVLLPVHIGFCPLKFFENLWPKAAFDRSCVINLKQSLPASPGPQLVQNITQPDLSVCGGRLFMCPEKGGGAGEGSGAKAC